MTVNGLVPGFPIFAPDTPLHVCHWLHALTELEMEHWPRRIVWVQPCVLPTTDDDVLVYVVGLN